MGFLRAAAGALQDSSLIIKPKHVRGDYWGFPAAADRKSS
jgi:hypothetical protein